MSVKEDSQFQKLLTEARKCFDRQDREKACYYYAQTQIHERSDAVLQDLGDFLVVATEYRPEIAVDIAKAIMSREGPLAPIFIQDILCCALCLTDTDLERQIVQRVLSDGINPNLCVRIADIYFEYGNGRRDQMKAALWISRAAAADAVSFSDWAAKAYALHLVVDDEQKAQLAVLGCTKRAVELAGTDNDIEVEALEDLLEALGFLEYDGSLIAKYLYEQLLSNDNIALPEKHRIWQDLRELQNYLNS